MIVLDTRLITGWELAAVAPEAKAEKAEKGEVGVPLIDIAGGGVQGGLF